MRLKDKVAVITGAASGFGKCASELFTKEGAAVAVVDLNAEAGQKVADSLAADGFNAKFYKLDISNRLEVKEVFKQIYEDFGKIDILINNAGSVIPLMLPDDDTDENVRSFQKGMDINLMGPYYCATEAVRYMKKGGKGGSIVNTSSMMSLIGVPKIICYTMAKAGVNGMTVAFANTYAADGIRVNAIMPNLSLTPRSEGRVISQEYIDRTYPLRRLGHADDIAKAMLFLASDESSYITGQLLPLDGGQSIKTPDQF